MKRSLLLLLAATAMFPAWSQEQGFQKASGASVSGNLPITAEKIRFHYSTFEPWITLPCTHQIEHGPSQDWKVVCEDSDQRYRKEYVVHLWVKAYKRDRFPRLSYELLYWVTDRSSSTGRPSGTGATIWFHLNDPTSLHSIQASQSVENDTAGLYLEFKP